MGTSIKVPYKKSSPSLWIDMSPIPWQDLPSMESIVLKIEYAASSDVRYSIKVLKILQVLYQNELKKLNFID